MPNNVQGTTKVNKGLNAAAPPKNLGLNAQAPKNPVNIPVRTWPEASKKT